MASPEVASPLPPVLPPAGRGGTRAGWAVAVGLMLLYVALPAVRGWSRPADAQAILPAEWDELLRSLGVQVGLFAALFLAALACARPGVDDLRLRWRGGWWRPWLLGAGYSVALRVLVAVALVTGLAVIGWLRGWTAADLLAARPKLENLVDIGALGSNPLYLLFMATVVSFGVAGLTEELWRVTMLAGLERLAPGVFGTAAGRWAAVGLIALAFGLAHSPQGWVGMAATTVIGAALGAIILLHRSIWEAVLAHGCFNATSFVLVPLVARRWPEMFPA